MIGARIENGIVVDLWEVPSLTAFEGVELFLADANVNIGNLHDGTVFTPSVSQQAEIDELAATAYSRSRKQEYAALNQFEMQFDDQVNGTTTWVDAINDIKARFPK